MALPNCFSLSMHTIQLLSVPCTAFSRAQHRRRRYIEMCLIKKGRGMLLIRKCFTQQHQLLACRDEREPFYTVSYRLTFDIESSSLETNNNGIDKTNGLRVPDFKVSGGCTNMYCKRNLIQQPSDNLFFVRLVKNNYNISIQTSAMGLFGDAKIVLSESGPRVFEE